MPGVWSNQVTEYNAIELEHTHNGTDNLQVSYKDLKDKPTGPVGVYSNTGVSQYNQTGVGFVDSVILNPVVPGGQWAEMWATFQYLPQTQGASFSGYLELRCAGVGSSISRFHNGGGPMAFTTNKAVYAGPSLAIPNPELRLRTNIDGGTGAVHWTWWVYYAVYA